MAEKPTRKTQARVTERERSRVLQQRNRNLKKVLPMMLGAAGVLFIVFVVWTTANQATPGTAGPKLQVDREQIDLGPQIFNRPVRAQFQVTNTGDGTLKLTVPQLANALEGC